MDIRESSTQYSITDPINPQPLSFQSAEGTSPNDTQPAIKSEDAAATNRSRPERFEAMTARAAAGIYPGCVPFGYRIAAADGSIEADPLESRMVTLIFELFSSGDHSPMSISDATRIEFGARVSEANVLAILRDCFYSGAFEWEERWYLGAHPIFLRPGLFFEAQAVMGRLAAAEAISGK